MCREIDYINSVITDNDISLSWLAKELGKGWSRHRLSYLLSSGKEISVSAYREIMTVLDRHQYCSTGLDPECRSLMEEVSLVNTESAALVNEAVNAQLDNRLTEAEKADIRLQMMKIRNRLEKLEGILSGGK